MTVLSSLPRSSRHLAILGILAAATTAVPARALVTATLLHNSAATNLDAFDPTQHGGSRIDFSGGDPGSDINSASTGGVTFDAESRLTSSELYFKNGVIAANFEASMKTGVAITFTNTYDFAYRPVMQSTLLAAGFGVSRVNMTPPGYLSGDRLECNGGQLKNCGAFADDLDYVPYDDVEAGFGFDVSVGDTTIYGLNGRLTQNFAGYAGEYGGYTAEFTNAAGQRADQVLRNFTHAIDDPNSQAYTWDDTVVDIALPDLLQPGDSVTMVYTVTTYGRSWARTTSGTVQGRSYVAMAYAAFGDPTGGKAPIGPGLSRLFASSNDELDGISTNGYATLQLPVEVYDPIANTVTAVLNGRTTIVAKDKYPYGAPAAAVVPEPSTWAMLVLGFGVVGAGARRRRVLARS